MSRQKRSVAVGTPCALAMTQVVSTVLNVFKNIFKIFDFIFEKKPAGIVLTISDYKVSRFFGA